MTGTDMGQLGMRDDGVDSRRDQGLGVRSIAAVPGPLRESVLEVGATLQLFGQVVTSAVRHPRGYWSDTIDETYHLLKRSWLPCVIACGLIGYYAGTIALVLLHALGAGHRLSAFVLPADVREIGPWYAALAAAGVGGTAITADLGARKIREELDALRMLGEDLIRYLVIPRVISVTLTCIVMGFISILGGSFASMLLYVTIGGETFDEYISTFLNGTSLPDVVGVITKELLSGLVIGVVACHKGMTADGGPEGVGRAVNQSVVISFIAVFTINLAINAVILGRFPEIGIFR